MLDLSYKLVVWEDIWYTAEIIKPDTHYVTFKVFEIVGMGDPPSYKAAIGSTDTSDLILAMVKMSGSIKWDHCMDLIFEENFHSCDKEQAVRIGTVLGRLYDEAGKLIDTWDT